jgi:hypothetical protein
VIFLLFFSFLSCYTCIFISYIVIKGTCKVRNEIETKRNETKPIETKSNETKRNDFFPKPHKQLKIRTDMNSEAPYESAVRTSLIPLHERKSWGQLPSLFLKIEGGGIVLRNETKRNETDRNEIKRNETK